MSNDIGYQCERGALIYSTPPYSKKRKLSFVLLLIIAILIPVALINRFFYVQGSDASSHIAELLIILFIIGFCEYLCIGLIVINKMYYQVKIYENGITRFVMPIFTNREGKFIPYSNMKSFSISKKINPGQTCRVDLKIPSDEFIIWTSKDIKQNILPIIEALKNNNISEID